MAASHQGLHPALPLSSPQTCEPRKAHLLPGPRTGFALCANRPHGHHPGGLRSPAYWRRGLHFTPQATKYAVSFLPERRRLHMQAGPLLRSRVPRAACSALRALLRLRDPPPTLQSACLAVSRVPRLKVPRAACSPPQAPPRRRPRPPPAPQRACLQARRAPWPAGWPRGRAARRTGRRAGAWPGVRHA